MGMIPYAPDEPPFHLPVPDVTDVDRWIALLRYFGAKIDDEPDVRDVHPPRILTILRGTTREPLRRDLKDWLEGLRASTVPDPRTVGGLWSYMAIREFKVPQPPDGAKVAAIMHGSEQAS